MICLSSAIGADYSDSHATRKMAQETLVMTPSPMVIQGTIADKEAKVAEGNFVASVAVNAQPALQGVQDDGSANLLPHPDGAWAVQPCDVGLLSFELDVFFACIFFQFIRAKQGYIRPFQLTVKQQHTNSTEMLLLWRGMLDGMVLLLLQPWPGKSFDCLVIPFVFSPCFCRSQFQPRCLLSRILSTFFLQMASKMKNVGLDLGFDYKIVVGIAVG